MKGQGDFLKNFSAEGWPAYFAHSGGYLAAMSRKDTEGRQEAAGGSCSILGEGFSEDILWASKSRWLPEVVGGSEWHVSSFLLLLASEKLKHPPILYILILCKNLENSVGVGGCRATRLKFSSSGEKSLSMRFSIKSESVDTEGIH